MKRWLMILVSGILLLLVALVLEMDTLGFKSGQDFYEDMFEDDMHHKLEISMTREAWMRLGKDIVAARQNDDYGRTGYYRLADVTYTDANGTRVLDDVGIRTKGNTSRLMPEDDEGNLQRAHFKLKFDFGDKEDRTLNTLNELYIKSQMNGDPTYVLEDYAYDLMDAYEVVTSKSSFVQVIFYVEDQVYDFGVYTMIEPINKKFIEKRYPDVASEGNLYKCLWQNYGPATLTVINDKRAVGVKNWLFNYRPTYDRVTNTDDYNYDDIYDLALNLTAKSGQRFETYIESVFDLKPFIRATALNVALGMPDDYWAMGNNYYLYFHPLDRIKYLPYDYDNILGVGWDGGPFGGYEAIARGDIFQWHDTASVFMGRNYSRPLIEKTLDMAYYNEYYRKILKEVVTDDVFSVHEIQRRMDSLVDTYGQDLDNVIDGCVDLSLGDLDWFMEIKRRSVLEQLDVQ